MHVPSLRRVLSVRKSSAHARGVYTSMDSEHAPGIRPMGGRPRHACRRMTVSLWHISWHAACLRECGRPPCASAAPWLDLDQNCTGRWEGDAALSAAPARPVIPAATRTTASSSDAAREGADACGHPKRRAKSAQVRGSSARIRRSRFEIAKSSFGRVLCWIPGRRVARAERRLPENDGVGWAP